MAISQSTEVWRPVPGYEGWYSVSNMGRVRRDNNRYGNYSGRILSPGMRSGYYYVNLSKHNKRAGTAIHRLVLLAFIGPPAAKQETRHINGSRTDNRAVNLRWGTHWENGQDRIAHDRSGKGEAHGLAKLTDDMVRFARVAYGGGTCTHQQLADRMNVDRRTIERAIARKSWSHVI